MIVHKITVMVVDFDEVGAEEAGEMIESARYPNRCIFPSVVSVESSDIGEWDDDHPLNSGLTYKKEFARIFANKE